MNTQESYNTWSKQYDSNINKTRDLEAIALREALAGIPFKNCLEIGCGTGKNTEWLVTKANEVLAVDLSEEMMAIAKSKIITDKVRFLQADITKPWDFTTSKYELISFSLVLEHIENLEDIFSKVSKACADNGYVYIGELHPFKQYAGSKARFENEGVLQIVECFNHHMTDFIQPALKNGFSVESFHEYFDEEDKNSIPRILSMLFKKK